MGKYSYVVFGCDCDECGKKLSDDAIKEGSVKEAIDYYGWTDLEDGRILCDVCYDEEIEK